MSMVYLMELSCETNKDLSIADKLKVNEKYPIVYSSQLISSDIMKLFGLRATQRTR